MVRLAAVLVGAALLVLPGLGQARAQGVAVDAQQQSGLQHQAVPPASISPEPLAAKPLAPKPLAADETVVAQGPILLELFTSQGCSACPPADRLLAALSTREDLLVLSFHVSYWDHMGWADPFAIPASIRRQRGYARTMRSRSLYTPQMVVQGSTVAIGSDEDRITRLLHEAAPTVALAISREGVGQERFTVSVPALPDVTVTLELWAVMYGASDSAFVPNGENAGHMLEHVNVVRQAGIVAVVERTPAMVQFDRPDIAGVDGVALILQARNLGPVVGTGKLSLR